MNIKKLVGAVSALAIAGSAFAGLAVTASAAEPVITYYFGSATGVETFDNFDGSKVSSTAGTFSSAASGNNHFGIVTIDEIEKPEVGSAYDSTLGYPTYVSGSALDTQVRGKTAATTTLATMNQINGKMYFDADFYSHATYIQQGPSVVFYNSAGEKVAWAAMDYSDTAYIRSYHLVTSTNEETGEDETIDTQLDRTADNTKFRSSYDPGIGYHIGVVLDVDNNTVTLTGDLINTSGNRSTTMSSGVAKSCPISDIAKVTLEFTGNASSNNFGTAIDNVKLYTETYPDPAGAVTVNYKAGTTELGSATPSRTGLYAADKLTYYYPAYIEKEGTVYKSDAEEYSAEITLTTDSQEATVNYTALTSTSQYAEPEDNKDAYSTAASKLSNGKVYAIGSSTYTAMTVKADGIYTITASAVRVANDSYRTGDINVNGSSVGTVTYDDTTDDKVEDVTLHAGDVITVTGNNSKSGLDYVLIEKTADIPVVTTHDEAFTFTKTASEFGADSSINIVFQNDTTDATQNYNAGPVGTSFTGAGEAQLAVVITGIADGYSVKSITIE